MMFSRVFLLQMFEYLIYFYGSELFHCIDILPLALYSSVDGPLGHFCLLALMNETTVEIHVQGFGWVDVPLSFLVGVFISFRKCSCWMT